MTSENEELGLIKINYDIFKKCLDNFNSSNIIISDNIVNKANDLINNYNCFISNYDAKSLWEKKKVIAAQKKTHKTQSTSRLRPYVLLIDLNDELKFKKKHIIYYLKLLQKKY